ncbi:MAG: ABC transporter ATP-binding protein [Acidobacteria bacterium]|nr:MAG: ABC transporter ATP-binding protein [Acidobacteriota bacterium]
MTERPPIVEARGLRKEYRRSVAGGVERIRVLAGADLVVSAGEAVAVQGQSGVGKTTLLNILGGLARPDGGTLLFRGRPLPDGPAARARWRRREVGFIFQFHGLLAEFTATENVALAALIAGRRKRFALERARELLEELGLGGRADHYPDELSGGEQQRVAVARALVNGPSLVLADEPTGNLDPHTGEQVVEVIGRLQERHGFALVIATHSDRLARRCHRVLQMEEGRLGPPRRNGAGELDREAMKR